MSGVSASLNWDEVMQDVGKPNVSAEDATAQPISGNMFSARTDDELANHLSTFRQKSVWTMFGSSWCHHCHLLFPSVYDTSKKYPQDDFVVSQMDYMDKAVKGIKYTPLFRLYKNGARMDEFIGTSPQRVADHVWLWSDNTK